LKSICKWQTQLKAKEIGITYHFNRADARANAARQAAEKEMAIQRQSQVIFEETSQRRDFDDRNRVSCLSHAFFLGQFVCF